MTPKLLEREIVRRVENARLIVIPETKHLLPLEAPGKIANLIREHCENPRDEEKKSFEKSELAKGKFYESGKQTINKETAGIR